MKPTNQLESRKLLDSLLLEEGIERPKALEIRPDSSASKILSRAQRRLWSLHWDAPEVPAYNIFNAVHLVGSLDIAALKASLNEIVRRHEVLRSCFPEKDGQPTVLVRDELALEIPMDDFTRSPQGEQQENVQRSCSAEARQPFNLESGPLLRVRLLRLAEQDHVVTLTVHHIVSDGWSMGVFLGELNELYRCFAADQPSSLPDLTLQYSDFARWQEQWLEQEAASEQLQWWSTRLADLTTLDLPIGRSRPPEPTHEGAVHLSQIPSSVSADLKELGNQESATQYVTLLAAFAVLLHRYSGQVDIVVGTPVANRNRRDLEPMIGFFVNSLVMRCDLSGQPSFREVLRRVREFAMEGIARQDFPFDALVHELAADRDASSNPLFQVMFSFENAPTGALELPGVALTPVDIETRFAKFDLLLNVSESPDGLVAAFEYSTDLYEAGAIQRMAGNFQTLLESILRDPDQHVATIPILSSAERRQLVDEWSGTTSEYPRDRCIHEVFEEQARLRPEQTAIVFGGQELTYRELNERSNRLARFLQSRGAGPQSAVSIHMNRSADLIVGMLAILKTGGFYVPLDPDYPPQRLAAMLDDCQATVLLTETELAGNLHQGEIDVICVDSTSDVLATQCCDNLDAPQVGSDELAYVIYTSGSTGVPKGVAIPHHGVVRLVLDTNYIRLKPDDRVAQASNASFDAATFEIWGALLNGAQLIGVGRESTLAPSEFAAFLKQQGMTTLFLTTALFNQLAREEPAAFGHMRHILFGGEMVDIQWVRAVLRGGPPERLLHVYGPTENTTFSTWHLIRDVPPDATTVPIGRAVSNTELYVLDRHRQAVPIGVVGELYLGGEGLAHGYLNRPELTDELFVENCFDAGRSKLYCTGDLVRWLPSGDLEFLGRRDNQVKIRGFRIEPGEIESALLSLPQVRQAVVLACEDRPGHRELVAYVAGDSLAASQLRELLSVRLPAYMVPAKYVFLDALPLNENGKIDRKALPPPKTALPAPTGEHASPRNGREECLVDIWKNVLSCERVGIHDNYFELGGDSIVAIQLVSRLRSAGWQVKVAEIFRNPTIAELASRLKSDQTTADIAEETGEFPLTAVQRWFFERYRSPRHHFNQAVMLRAHDPIDEDRLRDALTELHARHDALRLTFPDHDGMPVQIGASQLGYKALDVRDLRGEIDPAAALERYAGEVQRGIDLQRGPLLKSALFRCPDGDRLLLLIHHLAVDGVSWRILLEDLQLAYQNLDRCATTSSFRSWAEHVLQIAKCDDLGAELDYWLGVEQTKLAPLPIEYGGGGNRHGDAQTVHDQLSVEETTWLLTQAHRAHRTEIMDLLLTALGRALKDWTGSSDHLITLEGHGRELSGESLDLTRTVGWFTSLYPFVISTEGSDLGSQVLRVKKDLRRIPNKGAGYGILRYVAQHPLSSNPQISFNYLGKFDHAGSDDGLFGFSDESAGESVAGELERAHELDFVCIVGKGRLGLSLEFNPQRLPVELASGLLAGLRKQLQSLIQSCRQLIEHDEGNAYHEETVEGGGSSTALPPSDSVADAKEAAARIVGGEIEDIYPLSPMQEGLLFQSLYEPDDDAYIVQTTHRIEGELRADVFEKCWRILSERHAVLRSAFAHEGLERALQVVLRCRPPEFQLADLRNLSVAEADRHVELYRSEERGRGFDLQHEVLTRVALFRREDEVHELVWSYHHILIDGWCLGILYRELIEAYRTLCDGGDLAFPPVAPLRNYADWMGRRDPRQSLRFWKDYTADYEQTATLPKWQTGATRGGRLEKRVTLGADLTESLKQMAARTGVTMNTVAQCLWGLLLFRYNDADDVVFGAIVSGRPSELEGVEDMVGLFINAVPVRIRCAEGQSFADLLKEVQHGALEAQLHSYLPLAEIQSGSTLGRGLFDHLLVFENYPVAFPEQGEAADRPMLKVGLVDVHDYTHYDLTVTIDVGSCLEFRITYRRDVYSPDQMDRLAQHLATAARNVGESVEQATLDVSILPASEFQEVVQRRNATAHPLPADQTVIDLFEQQVERDPGATALVGDHGQTSYAELDASANRLALRLREQGVKENDRVGVLLLRGERMVIAILAVLKAGAAYVPLDPEHPASRTNFIIDDSQCSLVLMQDDVGESAPIEAPMRRRNARPGDLAYVIYTSGSTGRPKGCQIEHGSLLNYLMWADRNYFKDDFEGSFGLFTSMSFDMSVTSFFLPLIRGRTLHVFSQQEDIAEVLARNLSSETPIDCIKVTPSHISLIDQLDVEATNVSLAIVGGEALQREQVAILRRLNPTMRIHNEYGPTEATVGCICKEIAADDSRITIGGPIDNAQIFILDRRLQPAPVGVTGEICIAGKCLSRGYHDREELNRRAFIEIDDWRLGSESGRDGDSAAAGRRRLYKTGDLARWLPDGDIECLGRNDSQVKVRGFRIELGEVEACLDQHPEIGQAAVLCRPAASGGSELVAYLSTETGSEIPRLREWLAERVPEPMVPSFFVTLESLPLAASGKINRSALAELEDPDATRTADYRPAGNRMETALIGIWESILQVERIGVDDDFFELGGHSLKVLQVISRLRTEMGVEIGVKDFMRSPTIADLAALGSESPRTSPDRIEPAPLRAHYELSPAQQRLWLVHSMSASACYNMPTALVLDQPLEVNVLHDAFAALAARHEILRTCFIEVDGEPRQKVLDEISFDVRQADLRGAGDAESRARTIVDGLIGERFDLAQPPLFRLAVIQMPKARTILVLAIHHIVSDGWSMNVLYRELLTLYGAFARGEVSPLPPLRIQYKDFSRWQRLSRNREEDERYWLEEMKGAPRRLRLPFDFAEPQERSFRGDVANASIDQETSMRIRELASRGGSSTSIVMLSLFQLLLYRLSGQADFCIGVALANRSHPDAENLIGFFVNMLPIRARLRPDMEFEKLLEQTTDGWYQTLEHQHFEFDELIRQLNPRRLANAQPLFNVAFEFQQDFADLALGSRSGRNSSAAAALPNADGGVIEPYKFDFLTAKFDLTLFVVDSGDELQMTLEYDTELFSRQTAETYLRVLDDFAGKVASPLDC